MQPLARSGLISKLKRWPAQFVAVRAENPAQLRRGQLLAGFLFLLYVPLVALIINNIYYYVVAPSAEFAEYLISDLLAFLIILFLWLQNRRGRTRVIGVVTAVLASAGIAFIYSPGKPNDGLVLFILPIFIASFAIEPRASFWIYLTSLLMYTAAMYQSDQFAQYDATGMTALFVVAIITWVASGRLEDAVSRIETLNADLQTSNQELKDSYETTLEGWSHALDLRDKETEGHTLRVTELTLRIAQAMGFSAEQLVHVRRGTLLHDIGKMGVPDYILHKAGPLTEAEWEAMKRHPRYAFELLSPIKYLEGALDIPHHHHEKWDGTGYPDGLRGEEIPLAARIFAVVDVYDALTSDRPYREAWPKARALEYIRNEAGRHFDPAVVNIFLKELSE